MFFEITQWSRDWILRTGILLSCHRNLEYLYQSGPNYERDDILKQEQAIFPTNVCVFDVEFNSWVGRRPGATTAANDLASVTTTLHRKQISVVSLKSF